MDFLPITSAKPQLLKWLEQPYSIAVDIVTVSDGLTTGEAYIIPICFIKTDEDFDDDAKVKPINTGTIDSYKNLWRERAIRYLGFQGEFPVIDALLLKEKNCLGVTGNHS